jgi:Rrf2 family protein
MKLSAKTEYGCLAMLALAEEFDSGEPVQLRRIAEEHGIPPRFLVQILAQLKGAGLVASTRGAAGGYRLVRPPHEVTLCDVIEAIEGLPRPESSAAKTSPLGQALVDFCCELSQLERDRLETMTLADFAHDAAGREPMWYI